MDRKIKMLELFSGIGAQNKALSNLLTGCAQHTHSERERETYPCDWHMISIIAYWLIHCEDNTLDEEKTDEEINSFLKTKSLSKDGEHPITDKQFNALSPKYKRNKIRIKIPIINHLNVTSFDELVRNLDA